MNRVSSPTRPAVKRAYHARRAFDAPVEPTEIVLARLQAIVAAKHPPLAVVPPLAQQDEDSVPRTLHRARLAADALIRAKGGQVPPERTL